MVYGILHQRLQCKLRDHHIGCSLLHVKFTSDNVIIPHILDDQIISHMFQLHFQRDHIMTAA